MSSGILEVLLVDAGKLKKKDIFGKMDPYVLIDFGNQERKSKVAKDQGKTPVWNEKFTFKVEYREGAYNQQKITFRIMDKDTFSSDDFIGESTIYVKDVISLGLQNGKANLPIQKYSVTLMDKTYYGEIRVAVTFISNSPSTYSTSLNYKF